MKSTSRRLIGWIAGLALVAFGASTAAAQEAETAPDDTWVSISGTVTSTTPDSFRLDYGSGIITVEMDDFDFYPDGRGLMENDQVIVYGVVDDDMFEARTIEASTVYVENLGTSFYANPADEEDFASWTIVEPIVVGRMEVTGTVTSVTGREFTVDTGVRQVQVDTASMPFDPTDDTGFLQIEEGDLVKVGGEIDDSLFDERELSADWIVKLES